MASNLGVNGNILPITLQAFEINATNDLVRQYMNLAKYNPTNRKFTAPHNVLELTNRNFANQQTADVLKNYGDKRQFATQATFVENVTGFLPSSDTGASFATGSGGLTVSRLGFQNTLGIREGFALSGMQQSVQQVYSQIGNLDIPVDEQIMMKARIISSLNMFFCLYNLYERFDTIDLNIILGLKQNFNTAPIDTIFTTDANGNFQVPASLWKFSASNLTPEFMRRAMNDRVNQDFYPEATQYQILCDYGFIYQVLKQYGNLGAGNQVNLVREIQDDMFGGATIYPTNKMNSTPDVLAASILTIPRDAFFVQPKIYKPYATELVRDADGFYRVGNGLMFNFFRVGGGQTPFQLGSIFDAFADKPPLDITMLVSTSVVDNLVNYPNQDMAQVDVSKNINFYAIRQYIYDTTQGPSGSYAWQYNLTNA